MSERPGGSKGRGRTRRRPRQLSLAGEAIHAIGASPFTPRAADTHRAWDPGALSRNREGRLTDEQRDALAAKNRDLGTNLAFSGVALSVVGITAFASGTAVWNVLEYRGPAYTWGIVAIVALGAMVPLVLRWRNRSQWIRAGRVTCLEGPTRKLSRTVGSGRTWDRLRYLYVGNRRYRASEHVYERAPASGRIRLFVVGSPDEVINFEVLRDRRDDAAKHAADTR
jgi:hypothetical protein